MRVVIIGGGIIGLAIGYYLTKKGVSDVTVVERGELAGEASAGNTGGAWPEARHHGDLMARLGHASLRLYEELAGQDGLAFDFRHNGVLAVFTNSTEWDAAVRERTVGAHEEHVELLDGRRVHEFEPHIGPAVAGGLYFAQGGQGNSALFTRRLAERIRRAGGRFLTHTDVTELIVKEDRVDAVRTTQGMIPKCDVVVNAAGPWAGQVARFAGVPLPISPAKGYVLTTAPVEWRLRTSVFDGNIVVVMTAEGRVRFGGTVEQVGFSRTVEDAKVASIRREAGQLVSGLDKVAVEQVWTGLRPYAPDGLPVIGPAPGLTNFFVATGHFRSGFLLAPITGQLMAEWIVDGRPSMDVAPLSAARFAEH
jgi:glycine/D-amino acid oxidase-like deaminating enzyme